MNGASRPEARVLHDSKRRCFVLRAGGREALVTYQELHEHRIDYVAELLSVRLRKALRRRKAGGRYAESRP